jgi:DNA-directed RNA polymerase beta' subunit
MLSLLTDELTASVAAFDITERLDLNDPRFGNAGNTEILCPTCNMRGEECTGHHASLDLDMFMFHPLVYKESQDILNRTCFGCGNILQQISKFKAKRCHDCKLVNSGDYMIYAQDLTYAVRHSTDEKRPANMFPYGILPEGYVISKILVPPIHLRTPEDMEWSTEIQKMYEQLIDVLKGKTVIPRTKTKNIEKSKSAMLSAAYSKIVGAHRTEGIVGMLSGTDGIFRELMLGKRVDSSARTVITGDPTLQINEVSVPKKISDRIRVKVTCGKYNVARLKLLAEKESLWWENTDDSVHPQNILPGMIFDKNLENGDLVMLNRQPSLSKSSLVCFKVVLKNDPHVNVFSINPQVTSTFNADFDGDEMNTFFMSNTVEMTELCRVNEKDLMPVQDVVTGCYLMSKTDAPVSREVWEDCVVIHGVTKTKTKRSDFDIHNKIDIHYGKVKTTRNILSMCIQGYENIQNSTNFKEEGVCNFVWLLDKKKLSALISKNCVDLYTLQLVVLRWLSTYGLTVPLESIVTRGKFERYPGEDPDLFKDRCLKYVKDTMSNSENNKSFGLMSMIDSGAKGSAVHASHMALAIGQQYVGGKEGIFCDSPYSTGLTPREFFGHQMAAREGVVSTGVNTATTGYLNRRACKALADLKVQYNGTIADDVMISSFGVV